MTEAEKLVIDAVRAGVLIFVDGDCLKHRSRHGVPRKLESRIKANKPALLVLLRGSSDGDTPEDGRRAVLF